MAESQELPKYRCHKEVHALKIARVVMKDTGGATIWPADEGYAAFYVSREYVVKHKPKAGGYYVLYEDGYQSWSPADTFEAGYTRI